MALLDPATTNSLRGPLLVALTTSLVWLAYTRLIRKRSPYPLPPGPPGRFLVGNLGQVSREEPELDYIRWGEEYNSDIIYTKVLGQDIICINSAKAANDLLDKRGANYADRPRFTLFEIMGWGLTLTFLPWGPQFKLHRRLFQTTFAQSSVKAFRPIQQAEARKAVRSLLSEPAEWEDITLLMTTSIIFRVAFGQEITDRGSEYCHMAKEANDATTNGGVPGSTLVDIFPPARFLPPWLVPSPALHHAHRSRPAITTIHNRPWADNMRDIEAGTANPSFMLTHWQKLGEAAAAGQPAEMTEADLKGATGAVFIAGGNSSWGTVLTVMMFLTLYPVAQRQLQADIDAVVTAEGRLPTFADRDRLRALDDFVMEAMRCLPLNPLVIPHRSVAEDEYDGMRIPAGATVFANALAMARDPVAYRNPDEFEPDRYAPPRSEPYPPGNFGFGRRKCPGNFLALATVYIFLATFLAVFEIDYAYDDEGNPKIPVPRLTVGLGGHPMPFECTLKVRSPELIKLLMEDNQADQA